VASARLFLLFIQEMKSGVELSLTEANLGAEGKGCTSIVIESNMTHNMRYGVFPAPAGESTSWNKACASSNTMNIAVWAAPNNRCPGRTE
jgi:hypothetical protein